MHKTVVLVMLITLIAIAVPALGTIIHIPGDQPSIQDGVRTAMNGDTVLVAPGTYYENIKIFEKNVVVASHYILDGDEQFIENTVIDGSTPTHPDTGSCVIIAYGQDSTTVLEGFTLTGGTGTIWQWLRNFPDSQKLLLNQCQHYRSTRWSGSLSRSHTNHRSMKAISLPGRS